MAIELLTKESSKEKIGALADFLIEEKEFPAKGSKRADVDAFVGRLLGGGTATRVMVFYGDGGKARACALFSVLCGLRGDWVWVHEVVASDAKDGVAAAKELCGELQTWAKAQGCEKIAALADAESALDRELALAFELTETSVRWLEGSLGGQDGE